MKHLDGELTIFPRPSLAGERRAEIVGRVKLNGLLAAQEAVRLQLVAGAGMQNAARSLRRTGSTFVEAEARDRIPKGT